MAPSQTTILLVDENEEILLVTEMLLESMGHRVVATMSGPEALASLEADPDRFQLVITDALTVDVEGRQVAESILRTHPGKAIIFHTGFGADVSPERARNIGCRAFVRKPVRARDWKEAILRVLNGSDFYSIA
jgi:CheY-like chemotaxis protein